MNPLPKIYRWYRLVHPRHRLVARIARESERFRREAWSWPANRRTIWILSALRATMRSAAEGSPFYQERFRQAGLDPDSLTFADFSRLPPLERGELALHADDILTADPAGREIRRDSTGGSTGTPTVVWKGPQERGWAEGGINFFMDRHGLPHGANTGFLWGHHLDAGAVGSWLDRLRHLRDNVTWFDAFRLSPEILLAHHARLNRLRPDTVIAYGGALAELARVVETAGIPARYPKVAFVTGAEKVFLHERELIERVFQVPVLERYGSRDAGLMAFQADRDPTRGFEVDWPNLLIEPEFADPESAILVTKLRADAFPMIRYRIGDRARFPEGSRPGHPTFSLLEILGRELEQVKVGPDHWLSGTNFPHMFKDFPMADFQVYQGKDAAVEIRIVPTTEHAWTPELHQQLANDLHAVLAGTPFSVIFVTEIPRSLSNKRRPVISELSRPRP